MPKVVGFLWLFRFPSETPDFSRKVQDDYLFKLAPLTNLENPPLVQYLMKRETATKKFLNP